MSSRPSVEKPQVAGEGGDVDGEQPKMVVPNKGQAILLVATCTSAMLLSTASSSAVSVTLPLMGRDLNVSEDDLQWTVSAFSLSNGCLLIFFGRLADLYGRKKAFLLGSIVLSLFGLGCGFAQNVVTLNVLRGIQGLGPAAMIPAAVGILAQAFPPSRERSIAFATFSAGAPIGGAIGTQIGGILAQWTAATWRSPFYFAAGLAALCFIGGACSIPKDIPSVEKDTRVDWIGAALVTIGLAFIIFVLGDGELAPDQWKTSYIIALLILGVLFIGAFIWWQYYLETSQNEGVAGHRPPLMKLSIWKRANGRFAAMQVIAFLEWSSFFSWIFWAQLFYQDYQKLSVVLTAIRFIPMTIVGFLCNVFIAIVIGRIDVVYLIVFGTALTSIAGLLFGLINPSAPYWAFGFPAAVLSVFGADFVFASGSLFVAKLAAQHEQSLAGGLFQTITQLGTAFGLAITTIVHNRVLLSQSPGLTPDNVSQLSSAYAQLHAYQAAQYTTFAFAITGSIIAVIFLRGVGIVGHKNSSEPPPYDEEKERDGMDMAPSADRSQASLASVQSQTAEGIEISTVDKERATEEREAA